MKLNRWIVVAAIGLLACLAIALRHGGADEPSKQDDMSNFAGKCVEVWTMDNTVRGVSLENLEIHRVEGRTFLVGKVIGSNENWEPRAGKTAWVAVDYILGISEFDNAAELKNACKAEGEIRRLTAKKNSQN